MYTAKAANRMIRMMHRMVNFLSFIFRHFLSELYMAYFSLMEII